MERSDRLSPEGYRFFYDDTLFAPGTDTFVLSAFPKLKASLRVCDLGAGTGLLGLLLLQRQPRLTVTGVELQESSLHLAEKTAAANALEQRLTFLHADLRRPEGLLPAGGFDLVVCNPPYFPAAGGVMASGQARRTARSEIACTLTDVCRTASYLLRWDGSFCLVHRPERLADLCCALRQHGLEAKRLRMVCKSGGAAPSLLLMEGRRGGRPGLSVEPPLLLQNPDGTPSREADAIYFRDKENPI